MILKKYKTLIIATILVFLGIGLQDRIIDIINKYLIPLVNVKYHWGLDVFFAATTIFFMYSLIRSIYTRKHVSIKTMACILFLCTAYGLLRFCGKYHYLGYLDSGIAYLDIPAAASIAASLFILIRQELAEKTTRNNRGNSSILSDKAIASADEDIFDLSSYVTQISGYVRNADVSQYSLSIGIVGEWGYGKSSFFNLIENNLKESDDIVTIRFNPRGSKDINRIQDDFLRDIKNGIYQYHSDLGRIFEDYAETLNLHKDTQGLLSFIIGLFKIHRKGWLESFNSVNRAIQETGKRIIVFIDDLDRLTGKELVEVFKLLDKNGNFANVVYISAYDKEYVNNTLKDYLNFQRNEIFTDKYFEMEIHIPHHPAHILTDFLKTRLQLVSENYEFKSLDFNSLVVNTNRYTQSRLKTVRAIKRFVNQFIFNYSLVWKDVTLHDYFLLQLIRFCHPDEYRDLFNHKYIRMPESVLSPGEDMIFLDNKYSVYSSSSTTNQPLPDSIDILRALFPEKSDKDEWYPKRASRIYSAASFEFYFYNYECGNIRQDDFKELFEMELPEACRKLAEYSDKSSQVATYLLTRNPINFSNMKMTVRLYQMLIYCAQEWNNINAHIQSIKQLDKEQAAQIITQYHLLDLQAYRSIIRKALRDLSNIMPEATTSYITYMIKQLNETPADREKYIYSREELTELAEEIQLFYLENVNNKSWNVTTALRLSLIPKDNDSMTENSISRLNASMIAHPERYISHLTPRFIHHGAYVTIYLPPQLLWEKIMTDDLYMILFENPKFDNITEIDVIRCGWKIFRSIGYTGDIKIPGDAPKSYGDRSNILELCRKEIEKLQKIEAAIKSETDIWIDLSGPEKKMARHGYNSMQSMLYDINSCKIDTPYKERLLNLIREQMQMFEKYL